MTLSEFLEYFPDATGKGSTYMARCPAHVDKTPSLSISEGEGGKLLIHCHAGCELKPILTAVGLTERDLFPPRSEGDDPLQAAPKRPANIEISGALIEQYCAGLSPEDRSFLHTERQLSEEVIDRYRLGLDGDGRITIPIFADGVVCDVRHWLPLHLRGEKQVKIRSHAKGTGGARLYPEDQLVNVSLVFCEGELDALALISHGIPAITVTSGATSTLPEEMLQALRGKQITLLMDHDDAGRKGAEKRRAALERIADVTVATWPAGRVEGWDVTDELRAHGVDSIKSLIEAANKPCGIISLSDVRSERVEWLWEGRIPLGYATMVEGDPGEGKSHVTLALAADISRGRALPCSDVQGGYGNTLLVTSEDHLGNTIKPRLERLNADMTRVSALTKRLVLDEAGVQELGDHVRHGSIRLVVIDPITANLPSNVDMYKASDVRGVMEGLSRVAESSRCAIVIVRHLKKASTDKALHRGLGSIDFAAAARSVLLVGHQASNPQRHAVVHLKSNLSALMPAVGFEFRDDTLQWTGMSTLGAADLMAADTVNPRILDGAQVFLEGVLAKGPVPAKEVYQRADDEGISKSTLLRAKDALGIAADKTSMKGNWTWSLPSTVDTKF
jgi:hypothetical protein